MRRSILLLPCITILALIALSSCGPAWLRPVPDAAKVAPLVAWGKSVNGLQLGVRVYYEGVPATHYSGQARFLRNVSKDPITIHKSSQISLGSTTSHSTVPRNPKLTGGGSSHGDGWLDSEPTEIKPGAVLRTAIGHSRRSYSPLARLRHRITMVVHEPTDGKGWHGRLASGEFSIRRTRSGWALSKSLDSGKEIEQIHWVNRQQIREEFKARLPEFVELLEGADAFDRERAADALGELGPDARAAAPDLQVAIRDSNERVQKAAQSALRKIASDNDE